MLGDLAPPIPGGGTGFLSACFGFVLAALAVYVGLFWLLKRLLGTRTKTLREGQHMRTTNLIGGLLALGGVACLVAASEAAVKLDTAYVQWSSDRRLAAQLTGKAPDRENLRDYQLIGAPVSVLSPTLIWLTVATGLILIVIGARAGLRQTTLADQRPMEANQPQV
jgi:hypothetical protein